MKKFTIKNYKGNMLESLKKFSSKYKNLKIVEAIEADDVLRVKTAPMSETYGDPEKNRLYIEAFNQLLTLFNGVKDKLADGRFSENEIDFGPGGVPVSKKQMGDAFYLISTAFIPFVLHDGENNDPDMDKAIVKLDELIRKMGTSFEDYLLDQGNDENEGENKGEDTENSETED